MSANKLSNGRFEQRDIAAKHDFRGASYEPPQMVTAKERLELARNRARPAPQQHLRPKGMDRAVMQSQTEKLRERRINHIDTRLSVADYKLRLDRLRCVHEGRAKSGFNAKAHSQETGRKR